MSTCQTVRLSRSYSHTRTTSPRDVFKIAAHVGDSVKTECPMYPGAQFHSAPPEDHALRYPILSGWCAGLLKTIWRSCFLSYTLQIFPPHCGVTAALRYSFSRTITGTSVGSRSQPHVSWFLHGNTGTRRSSMTFSKMSSGQLSGGTKLLGSPSPPLYPSVRVYAPPSSAPACQKKAGSVFPSATELTLMRSVPQDTVSPAASAPACSVATIARLAATAAAMLRSDRCCPSCH
mmetsp:Transcript_8958/g.27099  ORF Transcript_8958/g.27099 Transcript_8958/m.27099 type:complete len:233 (-) Transcript_8958:9-707(-)